MSSRQYIPLSAHKHYDLRQAMLYIHLSTNIKLMITWPYISRYTSTLKVSWCSYMNKGSAATWASTFQQLGFTSAFTILSLRTFEDFITKFKEFFKHTDIKGNAIAWLSTTQMIKDKKDVFHPSLTDYISLFKNDVTLSRINDHNVLIQYFSSSIPQALMRQVYFMDTLPDTITAWYAKAVHFQTQWERLHQTILLPCPLAT